MSNSPLVTYTKLSSNHSGKRNAPIERITPHCAAGQCSVETLGNIFSNKSKAASSNYGIGYDGKVGLYVPEDCCSWCSSNSTNDQKSITIECASEKTSPYAMNNEVYSSLVNLCIDICKRNGKTRLIWLGNKQESLSYRPAKDEMIITVHRWFANKLCPGNWLYARLGILANTVTKELNKENTMYRVQIGSFRNKSNAERLLKKIKSAGFTDAYITKK